MLTTRQEKILMSIVDDYLQYMTPLSSNHLLNKYHLDVSPATIRSEMAKLETMGLLTKPHTSAGRVPTRDALRYYVKKLNRDLSKSRAESSNNVVLNDDLISELKNYEDAQSVADYISEVTKQYTEVYFRDREELVKGFYLTYLTSTLLLAIIVLSSKRVVKIPVECSESLTVSDAQQYSNYLYQHVQDISVKDLPIIINQLKVPKILFELKNALYSGIENHFHEETHQVGFAGFDYLLGSLSEEVDTLQNLYAESKSSELFNLVSKHAHNRVDVLFGEEIDDKYKSVSMISTQISLNGQTGYLIIIGPEIMSYKSIINLLYDINYQTVEGSSMNG